MNAAASPEPVNDRYRFSWILDGIEVSSSRSIQHRKHGFETIYYLDWHICMVWYQVICCVEDITRNILDCNQSNYSSRIIFSCRLFLQAAL